MEDFNIAIKQPDGTEIVVNTLMLEEDVIRFCVGLEAKEQD